MEVTLRLGDILQRMLDDRDRLWGKRVAWVFCPVEIRVLAGVSVSVIGSPSALVFHLQSGGRAAVVPSPTSQPPLDQVGTQQEPGLRASG